MPHLLVRQKVQDYKVWKKEFDESGEPHRKPAGSKGGFVFRDAEDPNIVSVLLEWDSAENLNNFLQYLKTDEMKEVFKKAGVLGPPLDVFILGESEKTTL